MHFVCWEFSKKNLELVSSILYHSPSSLWSTYAQKALIAFLERRAFLIYLHNRIEHRLLHLLLTIILTGLKSIEECVTKKPKAFDDNGACQIANELRWSHTIWFSFPITVSFLAAVHDLSVLFLSFLSFLALSSVKCILVIIIFLPFIPAFGCQCCLIFIGPIASIPILCLISLPFILSTWAFIPCKVALSFSLPLSLSLGSWSKESSTLPSFLFSFCFACSAYTFSFSGCSSLESSLLPRVVTVIPDPKDIF